MACTDKKLDEETHTMSFAELEMGCWVMFAKACYMTVVFSLYI